MAAAPKMQGKITPDLPGFDTADVHRSRHSLRLERVKAVGNGT